MADTNCIIYKNNSENLQVLKTALETLLYKGMRRDQNVFQYALYKNNHEGKVGYFNFPDLY